MTRITLTREDCQAILNIHKYIQLMNSSSINAKNIVFSFKKNEESAIIYRSSTIYSIGRLTTIADISDSINLDIDYDKFIHLLSSVDGDIILTYDSAELRVVGPGVTVDIIATRVDDIELEKFSERTFTEEIAITPPLINGLLMIHNLIALSKNNAGAVFKDKVMYADRLQVYSAKIDETFYSNIPDDGLVIHKAILFYLVGVMRLNKNSESTVKLFKEANKNDSYVVRDNLVLTRISNNQASIALPDSSDLEAISPQNYSFQLTREEFDDIITFFSGFFVGSNWKPLTFTNTDGELEIKYNVPSVTNISKKIKSIDGDKNWASFTLDADNLKNFYSKLSGTFDFYVQEEKTGILIKNGEHEIIFCKLT